MIGRSDRPTEVCLMIVKCFETDNIIQKLLALQQPIAMLVLNVQNRHTVYLIIRLIGEPTCLMSHTKESRPPPYPPPSPPNPRSVDLSKSFRNFTGLKPYASCMLKLILHQRKKQVHDCIVFTGMQIK